MQRYTMVLIATVIVACLVIGVNAQPQGPTAVIFLTPARVLVDAVMLPLSEPVAPASPDFQLTKTGAAVAAPEQVITYQIRLDNTTAVTRTLALTDTLPAGVSLLPGSLSGGLAYDAANHLLTWQGDVGPGAAGYVMTPTTAFSYTNLGDLPAPPADLCTVVVDCDEATAVFDLGAVGENVTLFGENVTTLHVSSNGFLFGPDGVSDAACLACPQHLPQVMEPNQVIAGLWRDVDMSNGRGQWYAAIVTGLLANPDDAVFYANWHNAAHFGNPFLTTRHAIAVVLDDQSEPAGRIYVVIDHVSDRPALVDAGYVIGVEDKAGQVGLTVAYAPCLDTPCVVRPAKGAVPADGAALRFDPAIMPGTNGRFFAYQAQIVAAVGTLLENQAEATTEGEIGTAVVQTLVEYRMYLPWMAKQAGFAITVPGH